MTQNPTRRARRTKIVFTIGPSTDSEAMLETLMSVHFVDVCRINMAHANHDYVRTVCRRIRNIGEKIGRPLSIMMDIKGPEIRTGVVEKPIVLEVGQLFDFIVSPDAPLSEDVRSVSVN
jgi:pyruvate kinase